jgi:hypothetical protein
VHDWVCNYERFWSHQLDRIKRRAEQKLHEHAREKARQPNTPQQEN